MVGMEGPDGPPPSVVGADDTVGAGEIVGPPPLLLPFPAPLSPPEGWVVGDLDGLVVGAIVAMHMLDVPNLSQAKVQSGFPS